VRACDEAIAGGMPLLLSRARARMQEGILSLMQLPKTAVALDGRGRAADVQRPDPSDRRRRHGQRRSAT
jgi:acetyl-CoA carboxylase beta subunit